MERFIAVRNIERFRMLLAEEKDPDAIKALAFLLKREEERLVAICERRSRDCEGRGD